jgi:hypothetical protein
MPKQYWCKEDLRYAARMLDSAADNLITTYPHSDIHPHPEGLTAVKALLESAYYCKGVSGRFTPGAFTPTACSLPAKQCCLGWIPNKVNL